MNSFDADPVLVALAIVLGLAAFITLLLIVWGILYGIFCLVTLPMRRSERARTFLDLLELGLNQGHTPEWAIRDAAATRDQSLGSHFLLLGSLLQDGVPFNAALELVPGLLPPQVGLMLKAGARVGDITKVLPACRQLLRDGVSHVRGALNYLIVLAFVITPFSISIPVLLRVKVLPAYRTVFEGMSEGSPLPAFTRMVFSNGGLFHQIQLVLLAGIWLATIAYLIGPRLSEWLSRATPGLPDRVAWLLPWRRKRLQRDFSTMLALLLEAEVPEAEAVSLAAEATANAIFRRRAAAAVAQLRSGARLPDAIRAVDDSGEFRWRLANALQRHGGFIRALTGWHEALDAKAFQLEQAAAQVTTTALVLINGLIVGSFVIAVFLVLIQLINLATLW